MNELKVYAEQTLSSSDGAYNHVLIRTEYLCKESKTADKAIPTMTGYAGVNGLVKIEKNI